MLVTVGHIPREISRHVYYFIKEEDVSCRWDSTVFTISAIPHSYRRIRNTFDAAVFLLKRNKMRTFVRTLYKHDFEGEVVEEQEEEEIVIPVEIDNDEENTQDDDPVEV